MVRQLLVSAGLGLMQHSRKPSNLCSEDRGKALGEFTAVEPTTERVQGEMKETA